MIPWDRDFDHQAWARFQLFRHCLRQLVRVGAPSPMPQPNRSRRRTGLMRYSLLARWLPPFVPVANRRKSCPPAQKTQFDLPSPAASINAAIPQRRSLAFKTTWMGYGGAAGTTTLCRTSNGTCSGHLLTQPSEVTKWRLPTRGPGTRKILGMIRAQIFKVDNQLAACGRSDGAGRPTSFDARSASGTCFRYATRPASGYTIG